MAEQSKVGKHPKHENLKSWLAYLNTAIQGLANLVLALSGLSCLLFGTWTLLAQHDTTLAGTALSAGLVLLLAASIDRFEVLKGLGMEARTRKLDAALTQATATLEQLRELAEISGHSIVALNAGMGHYDSAVEPRIAYETVQRVRINLKSLKTDDEKIQAILNPWVRRMLVDLVETLRTPLRKPILAASEVARIELQNRADTGTPEYQAALDSMNMLGGYEGQFFRRLHDLPLFEWSKQLRAYVEAMPVSKSEQQHLLSLLGPWLTRIDHLVAHDDLSDREEWFYALTPGTANPFGNEW
jgi:hypothetical protein